MKSAIKNTAIYARYSSALQSQLSIRDQVAVCRKMLEGRGGDKSVVYSDRAQSGSALETRPGLQKLLADADAGKIGVVVCEALDRLSRDQENIAFIYKKFQFCEITLVTLSEGEINELHIGLKGTMNALYLKDLADKTHRPRQRLDSSLPQSSPLTTTYNRPLTGIVTCGLCGSIARVIKADRYGCEAAHEGSRCKNTRFMPSHRLERLVIDELMLFGESLGRAGKFQKDEDDARQHRSDLKKTDRGRQPAPR